MQSLAVTAVAKSRMHTSLSRGRGSATVRSSTTSGAPYAVQTATLMPSPQPAVRYRSRMHYERPAGLGLYKRDRYGICPIGVVRRAIAPYTLLQWPRRGA